MSTEIQIPGKGYNLSGTLHLPQSSRALVLFAHGSGSSRKSPRNIFVAHALNEANVGTLLFDLLTVAEEREDLASGLHRFNIGLLANRLVTAIDWSINEFSSRLNLGLFGASTGAAAALVAAADRPYDIRCVVSRGGRPDLAGPYLERVLAPTLLLVGERDEVVIELNERALKDIPAEKQLVIIPDATHLFEEPGALESVAEHATLWFQRFLQKEK